MMPWDDQQFGSMWSFGNMQPQQPPMPFGQIPTSPWDVAENSMDSSLWGGNNGGFRKQKKEAGNPLMGSLGASDMPTAPWDAADSNSAGGPKGAGGGGGLWNRVKGFMHIPSRAQGGRVNGLAQWGDNELYPELYLPDDPRQDPQMIPANQPEIADFDPGTVVPLQNMGRMTTRADRGLANMAPRSEFEPTRFRGPMEAPGELSGTVSDAPPPAEGYTGRSVGRDTGGFSDYAPKPYEAPTGSNKTYEDIQSVKEVPMTKEPGIWKRIGRGLKAGVKEWARNGNIGGILGLAGSVARGGIGFGVSQNDERNYRKNQELGKLWNRYGQEIAVEKVQREQQMEALKAMGMGVDLQGKVIKNRNDYFDPLLQGQKMGNQITPEAAAMMTSGGVPQLAVDARPNRTVDKNGRTYVMPTQGPGIAAKMGTIEDDPTQYPIGALTPGSKKPYYGTGTNIAKNEAEVIAAQQGIESRNTKAINDALRENINNQIQFQSQKVALNLKVMEALNQAGISDAGVTAANTVIQSKGTAMNGAYQELERAGRAMEENPASSENQKAFADAQENFNKASGEFATAQSNFEKAAGTKGVGREYLQQLQGIKLNAPSTVTPRREQNVQGIFSETQLRERGKALKLTPEQIEAKIAEARRTGKLK